MDDDGVVSLLETVGQHGFQFATQLVIGKQCFVGDSAVAINGEVGIVVQRVKRRRRRPVETADIQSFATAVREPISIQFRGRCFGNTAWIIITERDTVSDTA